MFPIICTIGPFTVYSYGLILSTAVVVCSLIMAREAKGFGLNAETIFDLVFLVVVGGLAGARIFFVLLNLDFFMGDPLEIVMIQNGGLAWQGGLLAGAGAGLWYVRGKRLPLLKTADFTAPYIALGQAIGRIGCFLNGCCYGRPVSKDGWGIYFPLHDARLHPTQLYAAAGLLFIFFILRRTQKIFCPCAGTVFALYLILASAQRFFMEFLRADHTTIFWSLSIFQIISLGILSAGAGLFLRVRKK